MIHWPLPFILFFLTILSPKYIFKLVPSRSLGICNMELPGYNTWILFTESRDLLYEYFLVLGNNGRTVQL